ncbi:MAG: hypothetical protein HN337_05865 [Deltaproteobacteria bacterium]|nr:hypothetical protein [Deltaproteobacteria bacterium]
MDPVQIGQKASEDVLTFAKKICAKITSKPLDYSPDFSEFDQPIYMLKTPEDLAKQPDFCFAFRFSLRGWSTDHKGYLKLTKEIEKKSVGGPTRTEIPDIDGDGKSELLEEYTIEDEVAKDVAAKFISPNICGSTNWVIEPSHLISMYVYRMSNGQHIVIRGISTFIDGKKKD